MADSGGGEAASILEALRVALDVTGADREKQRAANEFLEQVKSGEVHSVANAALYLVQQSQPLEVRHYAFSLLQHLTHSRWFEVPPAERAPLSNIFLDLLAKSGGAGEPWAIKSRAAALVAEVIRQQGPKLLEEVLSPLKEMAQQGPPQAETVAMLLRWLPEDVTVHNEDLEAPARRALLIGLTSNLDQILPLLYELASQHTGAAMAAAQGGHNDDARAHVAVVTATLAAADAYSDWAPVSGLESSRLVEAAGALLQAREFRDGAAEFLKHVAGRRRPVDDALEQHDKALGHVASALIAAAPSALSQAQGSAAADDDRDFAERIAEGLAALSSMNAAAVAGQGPTVSTAFLTEVLGFLGSPNLSLAIPVLPGVSSLLRDANAPKDKAKARPGPSLQLPPEWSSAVLEAVHEKVRRCSGHGLILGDGVEATSTEEDDGDCPPEFECGRDYGTYRGKLSEIVRLVGAWQPRLAIEYACRQVLTSTTAAAQAPRPVPKEVLVAVEAAHVVLENVLQGVPTAALEAAARSGGQPQQDDVSLATPLEAMLHHLLNMQVSAAGLVHLQGRLFEACGPYLACSPAALPNVMHKLLLMLQGLALPPGAQHTEPNPSAHGTTRERAPIWAARLQVCTSVFRVAKSAGPGLVPHLESIAGAVGQMHTAGQFTPSEHNSLAEAIMVISTSAGGERQAQVLDWLLAPIRPQWVDSTWQQTISTPAGFASLLLPAPTLPANGHASGPASYWWIYHVVALFEKALRRSAPHNQAGLQHVRIPRSPGAPPPAVGRPSTPPLPPHPMGQHLGWIVPPLLHLLQSMHRLWAPDVLQTLPPTLQAALRLGPLEISVLLGTQGRPASDPQETPPPEEEQAPRNWLKGVREVGYAVLGTSAARVPGFFDRFEWGHAVGPALTSAVDAMEMRHLRLMVKSVVSPIVANCPAPTWEAWLAPLVPPVLAQAHATLAAGWSQFASQTGGPPLQPARGGAAAEIVHEKMLRDLSREVCALLALFSPPSPLPPSKPDPSNPSPTNPDPGLLGWLLQHPPAAAAVLELATQALTWPDTEAAQKALVFAAGAVQVSPTDARLPDLVGRTLLAAAVQALALESNAPTQADLLALVLDIYLRLAPLTPAVKQVLASLPHMTPATLTQFEAAVAGTNSVKEQRVAVRALLQGAAGGRLLALAPTKAGNVITNLTDRGKQMHDRSNAKKVSTEAEKQGGPIGLALFQ